VIRRREFAQKAEIAVRASSTTLEVTLVKTNLSTTVEAQVEVRLKSGNVDEIHWIALLGTGSRSWLSLGSFSGNVSSAEPVATITVIANGAGLSDTAATSPMSSNITVYSKANVTLGDSHDSVFADRTEMQTIAVHLTIKAVPYIDDSHVTIAGSSGQTVQTGQPVTAGDQLTVTVNVYDTDGLPIRRSDLELTLELKGKLNTLSTPLPLKLDTSEPTTTSGRSNTTGNVYKATIPEDWVRYPEAVELIISSSIMPEHIRPFNMTLTIVESSNNILITGSVAAGLATVVLVVAVYLLIKHGTKAKAVLLAMLNGEVPTTAAPRACTHTQRDARTDERTDRQTRSHSYKYQLHTRI
jgi:hypothetical protein